MVMDMGTIMGMGIIISRLRLSARWAPCER